MAEIKSLKALVSLLILMLIYISYSPNAFGAWSLVAFMNSIRGIFWLFIRQTLSVSTAVFCIAQTVLVFVFWVDSWSAICFYIFFINTSLSFLSKKKKRYPQLSVTSHINCPRFALNKVLSSVGLY